MDKTKKITCIIQARTSSKRLANKVLKEIEDTPVICHIINRIKRSRNVEQIILATTDNNSDKILMTNVNSTIYLKNYSPIKINSKYAYYNKSNHETNFYEKVVLAHLMHKATSENLDISFDDSLASMYNNVVYKKTGTQVNADRLEIDLITKNTRIFMNNESEKIKIIDNK